MQNRDQRWPRHYNGRQSYEGRNGERSSYGDSESNDSSDFRKTRDGRYDITPRDASDSYSHREKIADRYRSDHDIDVSRSRYDHDESLNAERDYDSRAYSNLSDRSYSYNDQTNRNSSPYSGNRLNSSSRSEYDRTEYNRGEGNSWDRPARFGQAGMYGGGSRSASNMGASRSRIEDDYSPRDNEKHGVMDDIKSFFGFGPKNYKRSDDRIREDICEALTYDHDVDASHIDVTVRDAVVTLSGTVTQRSTKRLAEDLAEKIRGVSDVRNELQVKNMMLDDTVGVGSTSTSTTDRLSDKAKNKLI